MVHVCHSRLAPVAFIASPSEWSVNFGFVSHIDNVGRSLSQHGWASRCRRWPKVGLACRWRWDSSLDRVRARWLDFYLAVEWEFRLFRWFGTLAHFRVELSWIRLNGSRTILYGGPHCHGIPHVCVENGSGPPGSRTKKPVKIGFRVTSPEHGPEPVKGRGIIRISFRTTSSKCGPGTYPIQISLQMPDSERMGLDMCIVPDMMPGSKRWAHGLETHINTRANRNRMEMRTQHRESNRIQRKRNGINKKKKYSQAQSVTKLRAPHTNASELAIRSTQAFCPWFSPWSPLVNHLLFLNPCGHKVPIKSLLPSIHQHSN